MTKIRSKHELGLFRDSRLTRASDYLPFCGNFGTEFKGRSSLRDSRSMQFRQLARQLAVRWLPPVRRLRDHLAIAQQQIALLEAKVSSLERTNAVLSSRSEPISRSGVSATPVLRQDPSLQLLFARPPLSVDQEQLVNRFHSFMYDILGQDGSRSYYISWLGRGMFKWPTDLWTYQQILTETLPQIIIETGTHRGGSAFFLATICALLDHGRVISIDVDDTFNDRLPRHERITYITGSSTDPAIVEKVKVLVGSETNVLVILDSDHRCTHVYNELLIYSKFVPAGGHLIVEDTNVNGHPAYADFGPGPWEAIELFLRDNKDFHIDRDQERFFWTQNPRGYLRRHSQTRGRG